MRVILLLLFTGYVAASAVSFFGSSHWFFDLFTHFRYQYVWLGFLLLPLFSWYKHICMAVVIAGLVMPILRDGVDRNFNFMCQWM